MMAGNSAMMMSGSMAKTKAAVPSLPTEGPMPPLSGAVEWLNSRR